MSTYYSFPSEPGAPTGSGSPAELPLGPGSSLRGKRVVIVEDEGITQMLLARILARAGMQVAGLATTGERAVELVLRERPDLVLMDINMPGPLNGVEASRRILAEFLVCIVVLTAYHDEDYRTESQAFGAGGYLIKPVNSQSLVPQLEDAIRRLSPQ